MHSIDPAVERIRKAVLAQGCKRVILLGAEEQMVSPTYRRPLAASGVLVLIPGEADRARLSDEKELEDVLLHGLEHGAQALVVLDAQLLRAVERLNLPVPVIS